MDNRFFSLIIVPDSGNDVKYSSFNSQFLVTLFGILIVSFFVCLFFIVGYHIKLRQEKNYKTAVQKKQELLSKIHKSEDLISHLSEKIDNIQQNDHAYRLYASLRTLDEDMYQAGVGGRVIFDRSGVEGLGPEMLSRVERMTYDVTRLDHMTDLERTSLGEVRVKIRKNMEIIDNTPTRWPALTPYLSINSGYGSRRHPVTGKYHFHDALDIDGRRGDKIVAAADGVVIWAEWKGNLGMSVKLQHKYGYETIYGHLDTIGVKKGQTVTKGEVLGGMGATGRATGVHLHYSVIRGGETINPKMLMQL